MNAKHATLAILLGPVSNLDLCDPSMKNSQYPVILMLTLRKFYSILPFGHLIAIRRDLAFRQRGRLKSGLRNLLDETQPVDHRLDAILLKQGRFHVEGVGLNLLSKVLAVHNRDSGLYSMTLSGRH